MKHTRRQLDALRERLTGMIANAVDVIVFDVLDAQGHAQITQGYNVQSLHVWVPAADAVELIEAIAPNGLHMLLARDAPSDGYAILPARDPGEDVPAYAQRCRELLP